MISRTRNALKAFLWMCFLWAIFSFPAPARAEIKINEVYYYQTDSSDEEWIELYNNATPANLKDWQISDANSSDTLSTIDQIIPPGSFVLVAKTNSSWLSRGIDPDNLAANVFLVELNSPIGNGLGNSGDRLILLDETSQILDSVSWGSDKTYFDLENVSRGHSLERQVLGIDTDAEIDFIENPSPSPGQAYTPITYSSDIVITEIVPEPADGTDSEFIELWNGGTTSIDLTNWSLDDTADGGSSPFAIPALSLAPGEYRTFYRTETNLSLNDDGDLARLIAPDGIEKSIAIYDKAIRGQSFSLLSGNWQWTTTLTPNAANVLLGNVVTEPALPIETISQVRERADDAQVQITGTVTAPPGTLSDQYLYIEDSSGGIQVYSYSKDLPELKSGDVVNLTGTLAGENSDRRIKTSTSQIEITSNNNPPPAPMTLPINQINESTEGRYVSVTGTVSETSGDTFRVKADEDEVRVIIRDSTQIQKPKMRRGDKVEVAGIVSQYHSEYRLLPFRQEDVKIINQVEAVGGTDEAIFIEDKPSPALPPAGANISSYFFITYLFVILWIIHSLLFKIRKNWPRKLLLPSSPAMF